MNPLRLLIGVAAIPVIVIYTLAVVSQQPAQLEAVSAVSALVTAQPADADASPVEPKQ